MSLQNVSKTGLPLPPSSGLYSNLIRFSWLQPLNHSRVMCAEHNGTSAGLVEMVAGHLMGWRAWFHALQLWALKKWWLWSVPRKGQGSRWPSFFSYGGVSRRLYEELNVVSINYRFSQQVRAKARHFVLQPSMQLGATRPWGRSTWTPSPPRPSTPSWTSAPTVTPPGPTPSTCSGIPSQRIYPGLAWSLD